MKNIKTLVAKKVVSSKAQTRKQDRVGNSQVVQYGWALIFEGDNDDRQGWKVDSGHIIQSVNTY